MQTAKRILIVEDEFLVGEKLRGMLEDEGYVVAGETPSGREAVEMAQALQPDLVMMDINLAEMDGLTAARQITARSPMPIVALTAHDRPDLIAEAGESGIGYYLVKPASRQEITRAIEIATARFRDFAELRRTNAALQDEIAERERAQADAARYAADLERSNRELEQFGYVISHDLRAPLRTVRGYLRLLSQRCADQLDPKAESYIDYAMNDAARMQEMIQALLDLSRVETQGRKPTPTDVEAVLERTLRALGPTIDETGAVVTHDPLPMVLADEAQLAQVFQNLIANALKFRREGVPPRVHVTAREGERGGEGEWVFSVADNGIGIDLDQADRIFQIFQRLHTEDEYEGLGIGLALCTRIIDRHGGRLWVESEPGQGSTFAFTLPARAQTHDE
jgi:signal transduction histidine kinase